MALFIEKIHRILSTLEGKNIATKRPPEEVDRVLYLILIDVFNKYLDNYVKTKKISDYLLPFKKQAPVTITSGLGDLPPDFAHWREVYLADGITPVDIIEDKFWAKRVNRKLGGPSLTRPIGRIEMIEGVKKIQVVPTTGITTVKMNYFKYPSEPKYNYTITSNRYVFQETGSIDVEFPVGLYPDITFRLLNAFGIVLREGQIIQVTEMLKAQEQVK